MSSPSRLALAVLVAGTLVPAIAAASSDCPPAAPTAISTTFPQPRESPNFKGFLRQLGSPCNELGERQEFLQTKVLDEGGKRVHPRHHFIETFRGLPVRCGDPPFDRVLYDKSLQAYEKHARREFHAGNPVPPLLLYVHGGLVPGSAAFHDDALRLCQFFPTPGCKEFGRTPGALRAFPIFVVWHSGFAEGLKSSAFASRSREASAHGVFNVIATHAAREQALFDFCVTHDDDFRALPNDQRFNLNYTETAFRTHNLLSTPNIWHFYQDEIADSFALPADADPTDEAIAKSDRVGLWLVQTIKRLHDDRELGPHFRVVIVGHSMGSEWASALVEAYDRYVRTKSEPNDTMRFELIFMAPAVPYTAFERALRTERIARFRMFTMQDGDERNDRLTQLGDRPSPSGRIYPYSLLYFISGVLNPYPDYPLLGMERYLKATDFPQYAKNAVITSVKHRLRDMSPDFLALSQNGVQRPGMQTCALHHGDFGLDAATVQSIKYLVNVEWSPTQPFEVAIPPGPAVDCGTFGVPHPR